MKRAGRAALRGGVTTVRDLGDRGYLSLGLRGQAGLPTILAAGPPVTTPAGHCHYLGRTAEPTVRDVRAAEREHAERGVDVIKIMASGGNLTPGSRQHLAQFPPEVLRAAVDEAHHLGLPVTAHAHAVGAIADAVAAALTGWNTCRSGPRTAWTRPPADPAHRGPADRRRGPVGLRPVPGLTPPPEVAARIPAVMAKAAGCTRRAR